VDVGRRYRHAEEKLAAGHTVVALGIFRRHGAFVSPEKVYARPIYLGAKLSCGQKAIKLLRR
jgi:hypothetical protein